MGNIVANISKGKIAHYGGLPAANDAIIWMPIETSGIESDATLTDKDDFSALVSGATNEQTTMGRKTAASVAVTVDDTNDRVDIDCADFTWTAATGNALSAVASGYDDDTTAGTDSGIVFMSKHDFVVTPNGGDITAQVATAGFLRAA